MPRQKKFIWRPKKKDPVGASSSDPPPPPPPWVDLPRDITANILQRLGVEGVLRNAIRVCTTWRSACKDPAMWRVIDMSKLVELNGSDPDGLEAMCRYAVDLSQGELVELTIEDFGSDGLILFIAQRASKLRRLRLVSCYCVSNECLSKAATQFPSLQDLQIHFFDLSIKCIKTIGRSCPLLKSFTYNKYAYTTLAACDEEALAVAETMGGLHHLSLVGNNMTDEGARAILDGCSHLESLDLRRCFNLNLEVDGLLGRCSKQIKDLNCPYDSICDHEFSIYVEDYDDINGFSDGFPDYFDFYDDDAVEFDYDDYADHFRPEYLDLEEYYPNIPLEWLL